MIENRESLIRFYEDARKELLSSIAGLSDELMTEPSLDGWSVKDHLAHLAFWDDIRTGEIERISAGYDSVWKMTDDQVESLNALIHDFRLGLSIDQVKRELNTSRKRLTTAILSATERGLDPSLYGRAYLRSRHEADHTGWIKRWRLQKGI